jgi:hypothetical protein
MADHEETTLLFGQRYQRSGFVLVPLTGFPARALVA